MELIEKHRYKQTEVGNIPVDWQAKKISAVCKLINGRGFKPFEWQEQGLPIVRIQNLNGSDEYNYYQGPYDPKIEISHDELLFAWSGSKGTSFGPHIWKGQMALLNYHTWRVKVDEGIIDKTYFFYCLRNLTAKIEDSAHGASALVHTQKGEMEKFEFPYTANKEEQIAIANTLSNTDALIAGLEKLIEKKRKIKHGAMQELLRPKEGWQVKKMNDMGEIVTGSTPSTAISYFWSGTIPWITPTDIVGHRDISTSGRQITDRGLQAIRRLPANTLLVTCIASIGKNSILRKPGSCNQQINAVIPYPGYNVEFLYYLIELNKSILIGKAGITATLMLSKRDFSEISFTVPLLNEQEAISKVLSDIDYEIYALELKLAKYREVKQGMMQVLLTGKIRLV